MAYITRNANIMLLFLIVLSVVFLVGATLFYQSTMTSLTGRYNEKVLQLKQVEDDLNTKVKILDQIKADLKLKAEREQSFTQKYSEVKTEKATVEGEKERLSGEKKELAGKLTETENQLVETRNRIAFEEQKSAQLQSKATTLENDLRASQALAKERLASINSLSAQLTSCKDDLAKKTAPTT